MKAKRVTGNILIALASLFTVYVSVVMLHRIHTVVRKETYVETFLYELAACAFFLLFALDVRFGFFTKVRNKVLKMIGWLLRILVVLMVALFLFFFGKVSRGCFIRTDTPAKHALVLGLALENGKPAKDLILRLDTAERYLQENPDAVLILTGGNPSTSGKSEADVMFDILTARGISPESLVVEDQAATTAANFQNAAKMIDPHEPVVVISSNYHMDRAVQTAKTAGFSNVLRLPAPSTPESFGVSVLWEVIMEINELTLKKK